MACRVAVAHSASTLPELVLLVPRRLSRARCRAGAPAARSTLPDSARLIKTNKMTMTRVGTSQRGLMTRVAAADEDAGSSDQDDLPEFFCLDFYHGGLHKDTVSQAQRGLIQERSLTNIFEEMT